MWQICGGFVFHLKTAQSLPPQASFPRWTSSVQIHRRASGSGEHTCQHSARYNGHRYLRGGSYKADQGGACKVEHRFASGVTPTVASSRSRGNGFHGFSYGRSRGRNEQLVQGRMEGWRWGV
ncbi:hypothetical protein B0T16DRAFT_189842 [Cercophora newfieldiana]|uniref:Uncharacterized protein n=1 Tax=Cercophora newfieldiana TaxID=92897 RepID=A0AA39Y0W9_9PEZI|nr:hypothetical protein B0T16DRAFT_189842 [Cercophora newfieldiana]